MALSANSPSERARQMIVLTERLNARLEAAICAFEAHRPQDISASMEETRQLSNLYRVETARMKADPSMLKDLPASDKAALRKTTEAFQSILERYERAVISAKAISEGILETIAADQEARQSRGQSYGPAARQPTPSGPRSLHLGARA